MPRATLDEVRALMVKALSIRGVTGDDADFIIDDYIDAELEGKRTHGLGKFLLIDHVLDGRRGSSQIMSTSGSFMLIDGHREIGQIAARVAALEAVTLARRHGVGLVALRNFSRFGRLAPYSRLIAGRGLVGVVLNNAGPPAVAPFGSRSPILGTNPISFGFPSEKAPIVIDFATSKRVWGEIRQADLDNLPLPHDAFLDTDGNETVEPARVDAVLPFGEHKGSALCLAIELVAGALTGAAMGGQVEDEYALGAVFLAAKPAENTPSAVSALIEEIADSTPMRGLRHVLVPGQRSAQRRGDGRERGWLDVADSTYEILNQMATGRAGLTADKFSN